MKKIILSSLLAASLAGSAFAGLVASAVSGDIILGFRDATGANTQNLMLNLGTASDLLAGATAGGGTYAIANLTDSGLFGSSTINSIYGSSWSTNANLKWAAVGDVNANDNVNANGVKNTLFGSKAANASLLDGTAVSTSWTANVSGTQASGSSVISVMYTNFGAGSGFRQVANNLTGAWTKQLGTVAAAGFGFFNTAALLQNDTNITGSYVASDLWKLNPTASGTAPATFLGTLAIYADGAVTFSTQAIPEPSTYAAILGVATLGFAALRRRKQALVA